MYLHITRLIWSYCFNSENVTAGYKPWNSWFKIIRCFIVQRREIPLYSLSDKGAHCYSNNQLICYFTRKRAWLREVLVKNFVIFLLQINFLLLHIITNDLTTKICNFFRGVLTKHILKIFEALHEKPYFPSPGISWKAQKD